MPHYRLATVRLDLVAALTVAALAVPAAMAYAELAGLTPVAGVDSAGLDAIAGVATSLSREGIVRHVARMKTPVYERHEGAEVADVIGPERFHPTVRAAVRAAASRTVVPAASV